ncbi:uncharacterized protein [Coffea arabica]|uniref:Uncharacterized protein LOC113736811 isoform X1 n=1 Tax=Coffea arabica TaxID=13443 RepID=A0A6P6WWH0_COFAR|nr:uncharacterized protein LOC113736811 isoform X1 [Coffea arabica]XP_027119774.1 uncharacterized protein LOC113736811 isoform X1 [Coffea arabica]
MACQATCRWSLIGLVAAFLDLAIAYFLLCASAVAFMASKFLGFFGLYLPCPSCYGVFGDNFNRYLCFQKLLIEYPAEKFSNVQLSVMSKFPFNDSVWGKDRNSNLNMRLIEDRKRDAVELEAEGSSSSLVSDAGRPNNSGSINGESKSGRNEMGAGNLLGFRDGRFDLKGKGLMHQRPRSGIRRGRKRGLGYGKDSSVSLYDPPYAEMLQSDPPRSPPSINKGGSKMVDDGIELQGYGGNRHHFKYLEEAPTKVRLGYRSSDMQHEHVKEVKPNVESVFHVGSEDKNTIRLLEQALEKEHAARAALCLELEMERSAAASAADEAMAMIQRLQEEKASIEMEARQYQRMTDEKSAYDAEEMNILKEIIVRREREKHFLEKELEAYREMSFIGKEPSSGDGVDMLNSQQQEFDTSFDQNEDPAMILQQLNASIDKKVMIETKRADEAVPVEKGKAVLASPEELLVHRLDESSAVKKHGHPAGHLSQFSGCSMVDRLNLQDKMISMDNSHSSAGDLQRLVSTSQTCKPGTSQEILPETTTFLLVKGHEYCDNTNIHAEMGKSCVETSHIPYLNGNIKRYENDSNVGTQWSKSSCRVLDKEPHVHDVHVIVDNSNLCNRISGSNLDSMSVNDDLEIDRKINVPSEASASQMINAISDCLSTSCLDAGDDIRRSSSDVTSSLPPLCLNGKSLLSDLQRSSLSVVNNEQLKIDFEVGWLQERLKVVQEGRGKLNLSLEHQEREKMQLKLLENMAHPLQEIQQLTETGKTVRQASLPTPSSKGISRKRRCRSLSSSLQTCS